MIEQKKRPTAATIGRNTVKVATQGTFSLSQTFAACKRFLCLMGCLLAALAAMLLICAPIEPGQMSISASWALAAVSVWLCRELYHISGGNQNEKG